MVGPDRQRAAVRFVQRELGISQRRACRTLGVARPKLEDSDRTFWVLMRRMLRDWKDHLVIVKPDTVVRWHRQGFRCYWRWRSRSKPGRPPIPIKLIRLIRRISTENPLWGAPRIRDELVLLGHDIAASTVARYMVRRDDRELARQSWRTFLANHMRVSAACDFFTVPTLTVRSLLPSVCPSLPTTAGPIRLNLHARRSPESSAGAGLEPRSFGFKVTSPVEAPYTRSRCDGVDYLR